MWARIQEMAIRREAPDELEPGDKAGGVTIRQRIPFMVGNRRYRGLADLRPFEVRQFYDVDTGAFLRWQHQARFAHLDEHPAFVRACREWHGGVILPDPRLPTLFQNTAKASLDRETALDFAYRLAVTVNTLHAHGSAHLNICTHSVLRDASTNEPKLMRFGQSIRAGWQDMWANTRRTAVDWRFAAPELIRGDPAHAPADIFAFGTLLQEITNPAPKSHSIAQWLASMPQLWKLLVTTKPDESLPVPVRSLIRESRAFRAEDRPTMAEAMDILAATARGEYAIAPEVEDPPRPETIGRRHVMVFVKPDRHAPHLFAEAMESAAETDDALLFVSLIPVNLAYGELEMFKAQLFKALGAGLRQCREKGALWGLRLLENVDAERAAERLVRQFSPDHVLCGLPSPKGVLRRMSSGVVHHIEKTETNLKIIDNSDQARAFNADSGTD